jgi:hypothetical protein
MRGVRVLRAPASLVIRLPEPPGEGICWLRFWIGLDVISHLFQLSVTGKLWGDATRCCPRISSLRELRSYLHLKQIYFEV